MRRRIEAKTYRARDRMDNGWFQHDAATPENSPNVSPASSFFTIACSWWSKSAGNLCVLCSSKLHKFQQCNIAAGIQSGVRSPNRNSSGATAHFQQQVYRNCNDWYKHEHTIIASDTDEEQKDEEDAQCHSPVPTWWPRDQAASDQFSPRSRRVCAEADVYWKRNHDGSAKDWYRHEHTVIGSSEANLIIATDGHQCCICGGFNMSPAMATGVIFNNKVTDKKACQQVLTSATDLMF